MRYFFDNILLRGQHLRLFVKRRFESYAAVRQNYLFAVRQLLTSFFQQFVDCDKGISYGGAASRRRPYVRGFKRRIKQKPFDYKGNIITKIRERQFLWNGLPPYFGQRRRYLLLRLCRRIIVWQPTKNCRLR